MGTNKVRDGERWDANGRADAPEAKNREQDDEETQAQSIAGEALAARRSGADALPQSRKRSSGAPNDDVQDLVDRIAQQQTSGRIDTDAYRGERNDDDDEGSLGPGGMEDDQPRGAE